MMVVKQFCFSYDIRKFDYIMPLYLSILIFFFRIVSFFSEMIDRNLYLCFFNFIDLYIRLSDVSAFIYECSSIFT